jgi:hypothetical protein
VRHLVLIAALAVAVARPAPARAAPDPPPVSPTPPPSGLVFSGSLAGGGELGLSSGKATVSELEGTLGWELEPPGLRAELGLALGLAPDVHFAVRPGLRANWPGTPFWLRGALDWSDSRGKDLRLRWVLLGAAWEIRLTSLLSFHVELDTGVPLAGTAGLPLLLRGGATFRL